MLSSRGSWKRIRRIIGGAIVSSNLFAFPSSISLAGNTSSSSGVNYDLNCDKGILRISGKGVVTQDWAKKLPKYKSLCRDSKFLESTRPISDVAKTLLGDDFDFVEHFIRNDVKHVVIENGITEIKEEAFKYCFGITNVSISNTVKKIGNRAFISCTSLMQVEFPNSLGHVKKMGNEVFKDCSSLVEINVSDSDNTEIEIGRNIFQGCTSLVTIPQIFRNERDKYYGCINLLDIYN